MFKEISNEFITLKVKLLGATFTSLKIHDQELLYQIEEEGWQNQDVVIFPLISKGEFSYKGKDYKIYQNHGLVRDKVFNVKEEKKDTLTLEYDSTSNDLNYYPFPFHFEVKYTLKERKVLISFLVLNKGDETMYFSLAHHPAFKVDHSISFLFGAESYYKLNENNQIDFSKTYSLEDKLPLSKEVINPFKTLVLENKAKVYIACDGLHHDLVFNMPSPLVAVWTDEKASFICVEPWFGTGNYINEEKEIDLRQRLNRLESNKTQEFSYSIEIID